ncbi:oxidoreductase NAD-binding domain-containing protein 1-like [Argonauta hians]
MAEKDKNYRPAEVVEVRKLSPTVKGIKLLVNWHGKITFKAGQWVHTSIPGVHRLGGYTLCNSPLHFSKTGILQLAVKESDHLATEWFYNQCKDGDTVLVDFGGTVFYDPQPKDPPHDLLLIAGGIGMNALYSIVNLVTERYAEEIDKDLQPGRVHLLYSSKTKQELLYKEQLEELSSQYPQMSHQFFLTQEKCEDPAIKCGRISETDIKEALIKVDREKCVVYLCLPFEMCNAVEDMLFDMGIKLDQIRSIVWW